MRKFEKISLQEYHRFQTGYDETWYNNLELPKRATKYSAGYDIYSPFDLVLKKGETLKIPTLLKVDMNEDEVLLIDVRSSLGFKHNVRLANTIGVVDKDYYNNENNEGHIFVKLYNPNNYDIEIKAGERFAQAIFMKYLITEDDEAVGERVGGFGSTSK